MSCHLCNTCRTDGHYRLRQSNQTAGESLGWQAGRSTDHGLMFRQCALASFMVAVIQCQALQWKWHVGAVTQCHWFVVSWSHGPVMVSTTFLSSTLPTEKIRNGKARISPALYFPSSYCRNQDCLFRSCWTLWNTSSKASFPHSLEKA